jgi:hypothetical protein
LVDLSTERQALDYLPKECLARQERLRGQIRTNIGCNLRGSAGGCLHTVSLALHGRSSVQCISIAKRQFEHLVLEAKVHLSSYLHLCEITLGQQLVCVIRKTRILLLHRCMIRTYQRSAMEPLVHGRHRKSLSRSRFSYSSLPSYRCVTRTELIQKLLTVSNSND